jgi:hypothetical protein
MHCSIACDVPVAVSLVYCGLVGFSGTMSQGLIAVRLTGSQLLRTSLSRPNLPESSADVADAADGDPLPTSAGRVRGRHRGRWESG